MISCRWLTVGSSPSLCTLLTGLRLVSLRISDAIPEEELLFNEQDEEIEETGENEALDEDDGVPPIDLGQYPTLLPALQFEGHTDSVYCCAVDPSCTLALTGGGDDVAYVWRVETGEVYLKMDGFTDSVVGVGFSFDGAFAAAASMDKTVSRVVAQRRSPRTLTL